MRVVLVVVLAALARLAHADCPSGGKRLPVARGAVHVDGVLDDPVWQQACWVDDFAQKQPDFGKPPRHPVRVAVAIAGDTLYVGARMWSAGPDDISDALTQRDDTSQAERFIVSIDPAHTRRLAYSFALTARGIRADWIHTDDAEHARDHSWNPVWVGRTRLWADGWSAELAIPLSQLRLPRTPQASWGINFNWYVPHRQEDVFWRAVPRDRQAWASWFGELTGLPPISPGIGLELLPYVASRVALDERPRGPLAPRWLAGFEAGLDARLQPLPGLSIVASINPDFGQVDADPAFVNLTAYEIRLPERRPFFIENNALFANAGHNYFYSRRIGALPRYLPAADELAMPPQVRILGALAAGGYVAERTQIALIGAVTDATHTDAIVNGSATSLEVAPLSAWAVARAEQQLGPSVIGATATAVGRHLDGGPLAALLPDAALAGGADARLRSCDGEYELGLAAGASVVTGAASAMTLLQQSSAHFFQRPDQGYLRVDPELHRLSGWHAGIGGVKRAGAWQGAANVTAESPGFELNDVGLIASVDDIEAGVDVRHVDVDSTARVFQWSWGAGASTAWNFGGLRKPIQLRTGGDLTLASFRSGSIQARVITPGGSDDLTRGGPSMQTGWAGALSLGVSTARGTARQASAALHLEVSPTLQQGVSASASAIARITPALRIDVTPSVAIVETRRQYVATVRDAGGGQATYGARYLFGHLRRREAVLELRATWSLSPDLVMTLYAQPFISVGTYDAIGELVAAGSADVRWYDQALRDGASRVIDDGADRFAIGEPDFRVTSLRSTAVLRWEPRPSRTLFVVWQQARAGASAIHTLALKLSYWFG
jgi:hypothetical protein